MGSQVSQVYGQNDGQQLQTLLLKPGLGRVPWLMNIQKHRETKVVALPTMRCDRSCKPTRALTSTNSLNIASDYPQTNQRQQKVYLYLFNLCTYIFF